MKLQISNPRLAYRLIALSLFLAIPGCDASSHETIATVPTQREAIEITSALEQSGIRGTSITAQNNGPAYSISVPQNFAPFARIALTELGLPYPPRPGYESLKSAGNLIPTRADDDARLWSAWGAQIERAVQSLEGVAQVQAIVSAPRPAAFAPAAAEPTSATITLFVRRIDDARNPDPAAQKQLDDDLSALITDCIAKTWPNIGPPAASSTHPSTGPKTHIFITHRTGPLYSPAAKSALAQARRENPNAVRIEPRTSLLTRIVVPALFLFALITFVGLAIRDRLRSFINA